MTAADERVDLVVVGGGPAGLAAATRARQLGVDRVVVLEREPQAGGMPARTFHGGFGLRDRRRALPGPRYAAALVADAERASVDVRTAATVVGWHGDRALQAAMPDGLRTLTATAVVLATGTRERPRSARLVPGDRPAGVFTTSAVQRLHDVDLGGRAVIVGAEHVSFSAIESLAAVGCTTVALVTPHERHQTYAPVAWWTARRHRVPVLAGVDVAEIVGRRRVESVRLTDGRTLACDTVVFTGDWIAEHQIARLGGVVLDPRSKAPLVDGAGRTSVAGVFAAGNLTHGALQADWCALEGGHVGTAAAAWVRDGAPWPIDAVAVEPAGPLRWVTPGHMRVGERPFAGRLVLAADVFARWPRVRVTQAGRALATARSRTPVAPGRPFTVSAAFVDRLDALAGPVTVELLA